MYLLHTCVDDGLSSKPLKTNAHTSVTEHSFLKSSDVVQIGCPIDIYTVLLGEASPFYWRHLEDIFFSVDDWLFQASHIPFAATLTPQGLQTLQPASQYSSAESVCSFFSQVIAAIITVKLRGDQELYSRQLAFFLWLLKCRFDTIADMYFFPTWMTIIGLSREMWLFGHINR